MYRVLDLFSGIGGFTLGLERTGGFKTVAFCEIDPFCRRVLAKHWPDVPCFEDVTTLRGEDVGPVDVICGGFPCQPFSTASRGQRVAIDRWPDMLRLVGELRPRYVLAENVQEAAITDAAGNLETIGYRADIRRVSASDAGADHQRNRWWVCAHTDEKSELRCAIDAEVAKLPALCAGLWGHGNYARAVRVLDGIPDRVDRLHALGNAVVPQIPELIGNAILAASPHP
jgi:DNA (cytosine-5)-methyltransferase 1